MVEMCSGRLSRRMHARSDTAAAATAAAMYRLLIPMLLLTAAAMGAPQETNRSGETYVKVQPVNETTFQNLTPESSDKPFERPERQVSYFTTKRSETTTEVDEADTVTKEQTESDLLVESADEVNTRTKTPTARFFSKLSYFQKPDYVSSASLANLLERANNRRFKSHCRCEKIWNCPKLQITVPRCPDEYFMCCF